MFTGIVEAVGTLGAFTQQGADARLRVDTDNWDLSDVRVGDSIAVSGVCLTVTAKVNRGFEVDVSAETLARTTFRERRVGDRVNLERALTLAKPLGGHLVSGHVDGVGRVAARALAGRASVLTIAAPQALARYIAPKGSICVDGVSLTVNSTVGKDFSVSLIPHTLAVTTLDALQEGAVVNLEVDLIARYLERLLDGGERSKQADSDR
jgi:riboflavin synthase